MGEQRAKRTATELDSAIRRTTTIARKANVLALEAALDAARNRDSDQAHRRARVLASVASDAADELEQLATRIESAVIHSPMTTDASSPLASLISKR